VILDWAVCNFEQLSTKQLYALMQLRVDVFVVEQKCVYRELDGLDLYRDTVHILGFNENQLIGYCRLLAPDRYHDKVKIGRVVVNTNFRGQGIASQLMTRAFDTASERWPGHSYALSAQVQVRRLYESLGFKAVSEEYLEDDIPHIDMEKVACGDGA